MKLLCALIVAPIGFIAGPAIAQEFDSDLTIQSNVLKNLDRSKNVSVQEQVRPQYTPLGIALGGLLLFPQVEIGAGGTTNTYLTSNNTTPSSFLYEAASARLQSRWSRHAFRLAASTTNREYVGQSQRNEHLWGVDASLRLDVDRSLKVAAHVNVSQDFENLFSGEVSPTVAALSKFRRQFASLQSTLTRGRVRTSVTADYTTLNFSTVPLRAGGELDQNYRDRHISRVSAQVEYARSPSVAIFAQVSGTDISYDQRLPSAQSVLNSVSVRLLGGVNADIEGYWRGSIGVGYIIRDYDSLIYKTRRGVSAEVNVDLFVTPRLTLGLVGRRTIEDITTGVPRPAFKTSALFRADYELLRNMIISGSGEYLRQSSGGESFRVTASTRYLVSHRVNFQGLFRYTQRAPISRSEARLELSIAYQL